MNLAEYQQQVFQLICGDETISGDEQSWLAESRADGSASLVKNIARWWVGYHLGEGCILSSALLRRLNLWEQAVGDAQNCQYIPDLIFSFLEDLTRNEDPMVAALARFEQAMIKVKQGAEQEYKTLWQVNPLDLISALLENTDLPEWGNGHFQTIVSASYPHLFKAYEIEDPSPLEK